MVRRGLAPSRATAREAVDAGLVTIDGAPAFKPATLVTAGQALVVAAPPRRFVSRGGDKLAHALGRFPVDPAGRRALDAGASTGGFTDCLLQHGVDHVVAVDVGYGQLHERLRRDPRVTVRERTNVRDLVAADLPVTVDLVVADLSFIGLRLVLPVLAGLATADADLIVLVKPQFEAGRADVGRGGVVSDPDVWARVLTAVSGAASAAGRPLAQVTASPLRGPAGNVEFLAWLRADTAAPDPAPLIVDAVAEGVAVREG